jgi:hypothetical protein
MSKNHCPPGLDNRCRDLDGETRRKRSDTCVDTLRDTYRPDFARGTRGDMRLGTLFERTNVTTLSQYLKRTPAFRMGSCTHTSKKGA